MLDFFDAQERSRRTTLLLLLAVGATVIGVVGAIYAATIVIYDVAQLYFEAPLLGPWEPRVLAEVAGGCLAVVGLCALFRMYALRDGGRAVARLLGASPVPASSDDPGLRRLRNVVAEMAIAAGVAAPEVYVLESPSINAFAAGLTPADHIVGVTRGAVDTLSRAELQGVIAHETSHLIHGDTRLNMRLLGVTFGLLALYLLGSSWWRLATSLRASGEGTSSSGSDRSVDCGDSGDCGDAGSDCEGAGGILLFVLVVVAIVLAVSAALTAIGSVGAFFARVLRAAVSRQREYLADAAAVEMTRNPSALATALVKVARAGSALPVTEEVSHLFFAGIRPSKLLSTHPSLEERIRRLDPALSERLARAGLAAVADGLAGPDNADDDPGLRDLSGSFPGTLACQLVPAGSTEPAGGPPGSATGDPRPSPATASPDRLLASIRASAPLHLEEARDHLAEIPYALRAAVREAEGAWSVLASALLYGVPEEEQRAMLRASLPARIRRRACEYVPLVATLAPRLRLILVDLALPALRTGARRLRGRIVASLHRLLAARPEPGIAAVALHRIVCEALDPDRRALPLPLAPTLSTRDAARLLCSAMAWAGHADAASRLAAYRAGAAELGDKLAPPPGEPPTDPQALSPELLHRAFDRGARARPRNRKRILAGCAQIAAHDGVLTADEVELLRAVAAALDCPLPLPVKLAGKAP